MSLKENLAALLAQRNKNHSQLANETGIPQPTIHRMLTGESKSPRIESLTVIADYFGISVEALTGGSTPAASSIPNLSPKAARIALHLTSLPEHKLDALAVVLGIKL